MSSINAIIPRLENWTYYNGHLVGRLYNDEHFPEGTQVITAAIRTLSMETGFCTTESNVYRLGAPDFSNATYCAKEHK